MGNYCNFLALRWLDIINGRHEANTLARIENVVLLLSQLTETAWCGQ